MNTCITFEVLETTQRRKAGISLIELNFLNSLNTGTLGRSFYWERSKPSSNGIQPCLLELALAARKFVVPGPQGSPKDSQDPRVPHSGPREVAWREPALTSHGTFLEG